MSGRYKAGEINNSPGQIAFNLRGRSYFDNNPQALSMIRNITNGALKDFDISTRLEILVRLASHITENKKVENSAKPYTENISKSILSRFFAKSDNRFSRKQSDHFGLVKALFLEYLADRNLSQEIFDEYSQAKFLDVHRSRYKAFAKGPTASRTKAEEIKGLRK